MAARVEAQSHEAIAGLKQREKHRLVGLSAGMRLHIREFARKELLRPRDRKFLRDIDELASPVIAAARITLRIFVREHRPLRVQYSAGDDVFGRDKLDIILLPAKLPAYHLPNLRVGLGKMR